MQQSVRRFFPRRVLSFYHGLLARLAAVWYRYPSRRLVIIGVTGTSGKTSVGLLIHSILERAGHPCAAATSAVFAIRGQQWTNDTKMTMLGRFQLQRFLRQALDAGCTHAIVETTSEGLAQNRHLGIDYDLAALTNLSPEHIESHGSFAAYLKAKERLFAALSTTLRKRGVDKAIVVNADVDEAAMFIRHQADRRFTFSLQNRTVVHATPVFGANLQLKADGTQFILRYGNRERMMNLKLLGRMNAENALAAATAALALGVPMATVADGLAAVESVPGRLELIRAGGITVIVDYAFHPKAMAELYAVIEQLPHGRIIHVLGATGGGRDRARRPVLGRIAAEHADEVIVTNEDPYDEDPDAIMDDVLAGALEVPDRRLGQNVWRILDRRAAIATAVAHARSGDIVLVTGKGNEQAIVAAHGRKVPWDDRAVVREALAGVIDGVENRQLS